VAKTKTTIPPKRDSRLWPERSLDNRTAFQRDRDRVLYTSAFHRLAGITQVASADEGHVFHNRLTHTLEVAQVARRLTERLDREYPKEAESLGGLDPDVAEACALTHDLGHPPFGHIAEKELDRLVSSPNTKGCNLDGFEGNAQSFRIVTKLALRSFDYDGLNLTQATLNGTLKYPWLRAVGTEPKDPAAKKAFRKKRQKWGVYTSEADEFNWVRRSMTRGSEAQSLEAQIMDWADDVTYAVHDVSDFFKAGLVPLDRLAVAEDTERANFYQKVFAQEDWVEKSGFSQQDLEAAFENLRILFPLKERYAGTKEHRTAVRMFTAGMIGQCVRGVQLRTSQGQLVIPEKRKKEIAMLKQLTWQYVILNPSLTTKQVGQRKIIRELFEEFHNAALLRGELDIFPTPYKELISEAQDEAEKMRLVTDMIAGMTEQQAINIHRKLSGVNLGSVLDLMTR
jgi:dGTPase